MSVAQIWKDMSVVQTVKWYECGANSEMIWVWCKQHNTMSVVQTVKWYECDANSEMIWVWCKQLNDTSVVQTVMQCCTWVPIIRVGQNYTFIGIYGVHTVFLAGKSPYIRSYTVQIYDSGQPYICTVYVVNVLQVSCRTSSLMYGAYARLWPWLALVMFPVAGSS